MAKKKECSCENMSSVINFYNCYFQHILSPRTTRDKRRKINNEHYPFIPSSQSRSLLTSFKEVKTHLKSKNTYDGYNPRFLDCGCGVGNIMLLAYSVGYRIAGIESDGKTFKIAKSLINRLGQVTHGDIAKFKRYHEFDVIYFYIPIKSNGKLREFLKTIRDKTKVGTIIISYSWEVRLLVESKKFKRFCRRRPGEPVYIFEKVKG